MTKDKLDAIRKRLDAEPHWIDSDGHHCGDVAGLIECARELLGEVERLRHIEDKWWEIQNALYRVAYQGADALHEATQHLEPEAYEHDYMGER